MLKKLNSLNPTSSTNSGGEKGFSLLELIIAMVTFLIVTGAIYGVLQAAQRSRTNVSQQVQLTKNLRLALNLVGRDTYNAGLDFPLTNTVTLPDNGMTTLIGIPNDINTTPDIILPIIAGNDITLNTFNTTANTRTDQVTFLFKDTTFNLVGAVGPPDRRFSQPLNISSLVPASGVNQATILPASGTNAVCNVNDIYVITAGNGSALGVATNRAGADRVQFASNSSDILGINQNGGTAPIALLTAPASMHRVRMITYLVTPDGILTRREYANSATATAALNSVDNPLVYGVENFQIQYLSDDGTISDNPGAGVDGIPGNADDDPTRMALVRQIRFTVNAKTVELDAAGQPRQISMTSTFATRNLGYTN